MGTVADGLVALCRNLSVALAVGVSGGGIAPIWRTFLGSGIRTVHARRESGAVLMASEASVVSDRFVAVWTTTGPGVGNTPAALAAARCEGAKLVLLSPRTSPAMAGRLAVQETSMWTRPTGDLWVRGALCDEVVMLDSAAQLPTAASRLARGVDRPGPFIAHVSVPVDLQGAPAATFTPGCLNLSPLAPDPDAIDELVARMAAGRFALWVGYGARRAAAQVRRLVHLTGAPVLATPRGKGVVAETCDRYLGVTGMGGHPSAVDEFRRYDPDFTLVLGSALGEASSAWDERLVPRRGFVHVDVDDRVPGAAFPGTATFGIQADVGAVVDAILARSDRLVHRPFRRDASPFRLGSPSVPPPPRTVRPTALLYHLQRLVLDATDIPIYAEPGSAMFWAGHHLQAEQPGRLRITGQFGSMETWTCGVVGAALARGGPALCLAGDGSMLMAEEVSTAVAEGVPAIWVVLNDGRYGMCAAGLGEGYLARAAEIPDTDFAAIARAKGAGGERVDRECKLERALGRALESGAPFVLDVVVDRHEVAPFVARFGTLDRQAAGGDNR